MRIQRRLLVLVAEVVYSTLRKCCPIRPQYVGTNVQFCVGSVDRTRDEDYFTLAVAM
jgi:hypothetical protein